MLCSTSLCARSSPTSLQEQERQDLVTLGPVLCG